MIFKLNDDDSPKMKRKQHALLMSKFQLQGDDFHRIFVKPKVESPLIYSSLILFG